MKDIKRKATTRRNREYSATQTQRKRINALLRDGYDEAKSEDSYTDFQVTLYTDELPTQLTEANEIYYDEESTLHDLQRLFGRIASSTTVHIDKLEPGFRISLLRMILDRDTEEQEH